MLILSRKRNEFINLHTSDGLVRVCVADIRGDKVRLGFEAPPAVKVMRHEIDDVPPKAKPAGVIDGQG